MRIVIATFLLFATRLGPNDARRWYGKTIPRPSIKLDWPTNNSLYAIEHHQPFYDHVRAHSKNGFGVGLGHRMELGYGKGMLTRPNATKPMDDQGEERPTTCAKSHTTIFYRRYPFKQDMIVNEGTEECQSIHDACYSVLVIIEANYGSHSTYPKDFNNPLNFEKGPTHTFYQMEVMKGCSSFPGQLPNEVTEVVKETPRRGQYRRLRKWVRKYVGRKARSLKVFNVTNTILKKVNKYEGGMKRMLMAGIDLDQHHQDLIRWQGEILMCKSSLCNSQATRTWSSLALMAFLSSFRIWI